MPLECFCLEMSKSSIMNQIICIGFNCKGITLGEKQEFLSFWMKIRPKNSSLVSGNRKRKTKAKETKEKKAISVKNLMGYDDIVCEFAWCTF